MGTSHSALVEGHSRRTLCRVVTPIFLHTTCPLPARPTRLCGSQVPVTTSRSATIRPVIRWTGSKRRLARLLIRHLRPMTGRYFEPFAGSASLFFGLMPARAVLCDINVDLIDTYRVLRADPVSL